MSSYMILLLSIVIWGSSVVATRIAGFTMGPIFLAFARMMIAAIILFIIHLFQKEKEKVAKRDMFLIFLSALIGVTIYYIIENYGVMMTSASTASMISGSYPAITLLVGVLFFHEKPTFRKVSGILISLCGIALLSVTSVHEQSSPIGIALLIFDGVCWALYNYIVQSINPKYSALTISKYQNWMAAAMMVPFLLLEKNMTVSLTPVSFACVFYLGAVCSCLAYVLYNAGLRGVSAFAAAVMLNLMPLSGTVLSALILHEAIGFRALLGGILIIAGVLTATLNRR